MKNESKEIAGAVPLNWVFENNSIAFTSLQTKFGEQKELKNCRFYFGLEKKNNNEISSLTKGFCAILRCSSISVPFKISSCDGLIKFVSTTCPSLQKYEIG